MQPFAYESEGSHEPTYCLRRAGAVLLSIVECPIARAEPPQDEETLGQKLDRGLDKLGRELRYGWAEVRASIDRMGVQGRVYGRLHWDKDLANATIDIEVREDKSVVLKGSVPTESRQEQGRATRPGHHRRARSRRRTGHCRQITAGPGRAVPARHLRHNTSGGRQKA